MYESTADVLYHMYEKVSVGGFVVIDDWNIGSTRFACLHYFAAHQIQPTIVPIDADSVYWRKTGHVKTEYWRYVQKKFY